jgi:hypothetical protein
MWLLATRCCVLLLTCERPAVPLPRRPQVWFVEFMVPWCRSCKRLEGMWMDLADGLADGKHSHIAVAR